MGISCKKYVGKLAGSFAKAENDKIRGKQIARKDVSRNRGKDNEHNNRP